jgi:cellulose 1,4-beta-cellobiosidase
VANAVSRGYIQPSWWLIDIEAGFELWQGGGGLAANSFSVAVNGSNPTPAACTGTYSVTNSWNGGFQGQVVVKDTGTSPKNGWQLKWTFPGSQQVASLWNGTFTQSGAQVTVTNEPWNGSIPAGGTLTVGFTANGTSATPASVTCT